MNIRNPNKFCLFYHDHGHNTKECLLANRSLITYDLFVLMITTIKGFNMFVKYFNIIGASTHQFEAIWTFWMQYELEDALTQFNIIKSL